MIKKNGLEGGGWREYSGIYFFNNYRSLFVKKYRETNQIFLLCFNDKFILLHSNKISIRCIEYF